MSVPSYRRTENKFEVLNIAMEVFNLTLSLVKNEQVIPKKNFKFVAEPMLNNIRNIMYKLSIANNVYVKSEEQINYRKQLQNEIKELIIMFMVDIQIAISLTQHTDNLLKFEKLLLKTEELKTKLKSWSNYTNKLMKTS